MPRMQVKEEVQAIGSHAVVVVVDLVVDSGTVRRQIFPDLPSDGVLEVY